MLLATDSYRTILQKHYAKAAPHITRQATAPHITRLATAPSITHLLTAVPTIDLLTAAAPTITAPTTTTPTTIAPTTTTPTTIAPKKALIIIALEAPTLPMATMIINRCSQLLQKNLSLQWM